MNCYSRQDVLRILGITSRQLQGWERAGLIALQQSYSFQDLGQLRILRALREDDVPAASIRESILAMKAVSGMTNPLLEACIVRTGARRIVFRANGAVVDPIRRQFLFDFERFDHAVATSQARLTTAAFGQPCGQTPRELEERFLTAVQAEESGNKQRAIALYEEILALDSNYAPAAINLGTLHFHLKEYAAAEALYRRAIQADPKYVLAYFDLGNVLDELDRSDESIAAYEKAVALAPGYADAHYNLALAYERKQQNRPALRHWKAYLRLDASGPWADHARQRVALLLESDKLSIAWRADRFVPPRKGSADLKLA